MKPVTWNLDPLEPLDTDIAGQATVAGRIEVIGSHVRACRRCDLHVNRRKAVPGEGDAAASLMIVGEAPGENEDRLGRPFVGKAGEVLDRLLETADFQRESIFITSIVKCRPTNSMDDKLRNRAPRMPEINACRPYLVRQIEIMQPRVILCLGAHAARSCIDAGFNITGQRGQWFEGPFGSRLMATFHPAFILRRGGAGSGAVELKKLVAGDLRLIRDYLDSKA